MQSTVIQTNELLISTLKSKFEVSNNKEVNIFSLIQEEYQDGVTLITREEISAFLRPCKNISNSYPNEFFHNRKKYFFYKGITDKLLENIELINAIEIDINGDIINLIKVSMPRWVTFLLFSLTSVHLINQ